MFGGVQRPQEEQDISFPNFGAIVSTVANGFILQVNGRMFVVQTGGHSPDNFKQVIKALKMAYRAELDKSGFVYEKADTSANNRSP